MLRNRRRRDSRCYKTPKCFACASPLVVELRDGEAYWNVFGRGARFAAGYVELRDGLFGAGTRFGVGSLYVELWDGEAVGGVAPAMAPSSSIREAVRGVVLP